jgi:hypothetical protein
MPSLVRQGSTTVDVPSPGAQRRGLAALLPGERQADDRLVERAAAPREPGRRRPGRPPHPPLVRALGQVQRALDAVLAEEWVAAAGRGVPVERAEVLLDEIEQRLERLERALESVRARVAPRR